MISPLLPGPFLETPGSGSQDAAEVFAVKIVLSLIDKTTRYNSNSTEPGVKSRDKANQIIITMGGGRPKAAPPLLIIFLGFGPGFHSGV